MEDKIMNNRYNAVDYGNACVSSGSIRIHPDASDLYEESTTDCIEDMYVRKRMESEMYDMYVNSPFYEKYGKICRNVERCDIGEMYRYFKYRLMDDFGYNIVQAFCAIAEFFEFNYKTLYCDVISLRDKADILNMMDTGYGLDREFEKSSTLF